MGIVSKQNASIPQRIPRAIAKGHAIANKNTFTRKGQSLLQKIPNGIISPANIGPINRTTGANIIMPSIFVIVQQKFWLPN
jgi:hypothetical protein